MSENTITLEIKGLIELKEQTKKITEIIKELQQEVETFNNIKITFGNEN